MIKSKKGLIHRYQRPNVTEYFEFDDYAMSIHHRNDRGILTPSLTWGDVQILGIDSLKVKYLEYNCERY